MSYLDVFKKKFTSVFADELVIKEATMLLGEKRVRKSNAPE